MYGSELRLSIDKSQVRFHKTIYIYIYYIILYNIYMYYIYIIYIYNIYTVADPGFS